MKPSAALESKRSEVLAAFKRSKTSNPRIFGSVLHGVDTEDSDLDLLVDARPGATLFDLGLLQEELEEILGVPVDINTPADLPQKFRDQVLLEAKSI